ncbi:MAG: UDP-N-acetylmuramoyl-L-alanyl-D-glutamate--2,6-diaminopimelate ligase, partial [Gammaproteobacteria bacterium]|nr:UDP-N-acetylmuramoyl-L-alanyl-D-glutamate--2,6-diaminopimelate ligase [Gammaproteobacteria bacterium]
HTPNGLENVLRSCRKLVSAQAKLICLFGCGGERDREKRPLMGGIAEQFADLVVISADNSRSEKTLDIVEGILAGIGDQARVIVIEDRREAIDYAISQANKEDLVLLAGKGAELTQTLSHGEFAFSDYQCALDVLNKRGLH